MIGFCVAKSACTDDIHQLHKKWQTLQMEIENDPHSEGQRHAHAQPPTPTLAVPTSLLSREILHLQLKLAAAQTLALLQKFEISPPSESVKPPAVIPFQQPVNTASTLCLSNDDNMKNVLSSLAPTVQGAFSLTGQIAANSHHASQPLSAALATPSEMPARVKGWLRCNEAVSTADCARGQSNHFWDQTLAVNTPAGSSEAVQDFASTAWKNEESNTSRPQMGHAPSSHPLPCKPSRRASTTSEVEPVSVKMEHPMWAGRRGKVPSRRKNKKAVYWTAEDHERFLAGLEQFGLGGGLGPGGAELMSVYMGNRSALQIKSHMQKHLADLASGKPASFHSSSPSSIARPPDACSSPLFRVE